MNQADLWQEMKQWKELGLGFRVPPEGPARDEMVRSWFSFLEKHGFFTTEDLEKGSAMMITDGGRPSAPKLARHMSEARGERMERAAVERKKQEMAEIEKLLKGEQGNKLARIYFPKLFQALALDPPRREFAIADVYQKLSEAEKPDATMLVFNDQDGSSERVNARQFWLEASKAAAKRAVALAKEATNGNER